MLKTNAYRKENQETLFYIKHIPIYDFEIATVGVFECITVFDAKA